MDIQTLGAVAAKTKAKKKTTAKTNTASNITSGARQVIYEGEAVLANTLATIEDANAGIVKEFEQNGWNLEDKKILTLAPSQNNGILDYGILSYNVKILIKTTVPNAQSVEDVFTRAKNILANAKEYFGNVVLKDITLRIQRDDLSSLLRASQNTRDRLAANVAANNKNISQKIANDGSISTAINNAFEDVQQKGLIGSIADKTGKGLFGEDVSLFGAKIPSAYLYGGGVLLGIWLITKSGARVPYITR